MRSAVGWIFLANLIVLASTQVLLAGQASGFDSQQSDLEEPVTEQGRQLVSLSAVRLDTPLQIDGRLSETLYTSVKPVSDFIQNEPFPGTPATERTEVWVSFDLVYVYVSVRAWESEPGRMIVNEMRRDSPNLLQNANFAFMLDTFNDGRNGVVFQFNPAGGRMDGQFANESQLSNDWNPVWELSTAQFNGGWTAEVAIPFKSLRYRPGSSQIWGFNARRINRWKNEVSYLTPITAGLGVEGITRASQAANLVGLEVPRASRVLELKPFFVSDVSSKRVDASHLRNEFGGDVGFDVKYGLTPNVTLDVTYNTDFAQVEADEQQVNLTRFSLFFPEKREFFLENEGLFSFGGAQGRGAVPFMFYSRRIGLAQGREVPIVAGARMTGTIGRFGLGLINIQSEEVSGGPEATNISVVRLRRDILRRSSVGVLLTRRSVSARGTGSNKFYGVDGRFAFFENLTINTYLAKTETEGLEGDDISYRMQLNYNGDRYGFVAHRLRVGGNFNPEVGFLFRSDVAKYYSRLRFSPRPTSIAAVRKFTYQTSIDYFENGLGEVQTRHLTGTFSAEFESSDIFSVTYDNFREVLAEPFRISDDVTVPSGEYGFANLNVSFALGQQRVVSGTLSFEYGSFWDGQKTSMGFSGGRIEMSPQISLEPSVSLNRVSLSLGNFHTNLVGSRVTYTATPRMFVSGLVQYNSGSRSVDSNVRFRWEYQPGSELFVVYNETRDTEHPTLPGVQDRALIIKINRLFRP
jgi:hypothetical protein